MATVFVPKETRDGEQRVAATPETIAKMVAAGLTVRVEQGAGIGAHVADKAYEGAGATLTTERGKALAEAALVLAVTHPEASDLEQMQAGAIWVGLLAPARNLSLVKQLAEGQISAFAMELVPRITRAQVMDALSSQASIAGYKAVLLAASKLAKYFPLMMTAAGTIKPARVVVMGAGVAGLQALATARRLGAVVEVSDIRDVVKEQIESLGGKFIPLPETEESGEGEGGYAKEMTADFLRRQREIVTEHVARADVVICTALVPGKKAPTLITRQMVEGMRSGAVIVDLAVGQGGNCELSEEGREVVHGGVLILGPANLPAETAIDASALYARNVWALVEPLVGEGGALTLDLDDEVVAGALLTHGGEVRDERTRQSLEGEDA